MSYGFTTYADKHGVSCFPFIKIGKESLLIMYSPDRSELLWLVSQHSYFDVRAKS